MATIKNHSIPAISNVVQAKCITLSEGIEFISWLSLQNIVNVYPRRYPISHQASVPLQVC